MTPMPTVTQMPTMTLDDGQSMIVKGFLVHKPNEPKTEIQCI